MGTGALVACAGDVHQTSLSGGRGPFASLGESRPSQFIWLLWPSQGLGFLALTVT